MSTVPEPVAVIGGAGDLGQGFCGYLLSLGVEIIIGSRKEEKAKRVLGELCERHSFGPETRALAQGFQNVEAAERGRLILLAIPFWGHDRILPDLVSHVHDKTVVDTSVPLSENDPTRYAEPEAGSAALHVDQLLEGKARLVAGFHTVSAHSFQKLETLRENEVFFCGDEDGKQDLINLLNVMKLTGHDAGGLERSATLERLTPMIIHFNRLYKRSGIGLRLTGV